jgi:FkbM family methyltransferase
MAFIPTDEIEWKEVKYLRRGETRQYDYKFWMNEPLASWDVWDYWERERIKSMRKHLTKSDILFDIGTEQGWCNLVYASMINPYNIVLIEPTPEFWSNIKALWQKNYPDVDPLACYDGLFSDKTTDDRDDFWQFPESAHSGQIIDRNKYVYLHEEHADTPEITMDDFCERTGIVPTALTMDTEGSEMLILMGAEETLKNNNMKLWISIHDDLAERDYGVLPTETIKYLKTLGYTGTELAVDHEAHWYFTK